MTEDTAARVEALRDGFLEGLMNPDSHGTPDTFEWMAYNLDAIIAAARAESAPVGLVEALVESLDDAERELHHWVDLERRRCPGWLEMGYEPWSNKPSLALWSVEADETRAKARAYLAARAESAPVGLVEAYREGLTAAIAIVQQSLDTVRGEDDGESRAIRSSIGAREHIIRLLTGYRDNVMPDLSHLAARPAAPAPSRGEVCAWVARDGARCLGLRGWSVHLPSIADPDYHPFTPAPRPETAP